MISNNNTDHLANTLSGKTARACDSCAKKRARWYCASDDAFLCQSCDKSVYSANTLSQRHHRVRLNTDSLKQPKKLPTWARELTQKPRTPRHGKKSFKSIHRKQNPLYMVPDLGKEDEDQIIYRVPIYHRFSSEEFTVDAETFLGERFDDESYGIDELSLIDYVPNNDDGRECDLEEIKKCEIEIENNNEVGFNGQFDLSLKYHDDFPMAPIKTQPCFENGFSSACNNSENHGRCNSSTVEEIKGNYEECRRREILLKLDYEEVCVKWTSQSRVSPWINGPILAQMIVGLIAWTDVE